MRAVFLDRDGVLNNSVIRNGKPYPPSSLAEVVLPCDAHSALQIMKSAGYLLICATNQPDVAKGITSKDVVESINEKLKAELPLDEIRVCYHEDNDQCTCRKPLPGLLLEAAKVHSIDLKNSFMIGDRWRDIEAGQQAGCRTIWLYQHYDEKGPAQPPDFIAANLTEAAEWIINTMN